MARVSKHPVLPIPSDDTVSFEFEGRQLTARRGEALSSALFAHGIKIFGVHPGDGTPQGIFCANGQCSQCMVIADGRPVKACMEPVREGMRVNQLVNLPAVPELDREAIELSEIEEQSCDLLVIGAGPSGLGAAIEAAAAGLDVLVVDDKDRPGGKLVLQTHTFFGSVNQCYAGTRGIDIAELLAAEAGRYRNLELKLSTMAVGVYSDSKMGIVERGERYSLVAPKHLLVATGAREKALVFPGCELPGVYGAGAFQTILNRDLIAPSEKLFIVGGGNVGLIAAYHALQAGIAVVGLIEGLPEVGGYWVHADKIRRLGVPIYTSTTVVSANGKDAVESVTVAEVDAQWKVKPGTHRTYPCDTLLIAVGLEQVNELYLAAQRFGFDAYVAGDAEEIAEASAAMFSGRVAGREIARAHGSDVEVPEQWREMTRVLKSKPGREDLPVEAPAEAEVFPLLRCRETIPCNPCMEVCPHDLIRMPEGGSILSRAEFEGSLCRACGKCVAACPGLAITLVDRKGAPDGKALVTLPFEFLPEFGVGDSVPAVDAAGEPLCEARVVKLIDRLGRAPCSLACPAGVHVQGYIELIRKRRFADAAALLRSDLPLVSVCGRVCYQPCEAECERGRIIDEPVSILALKRFVGDWALEHIETVDPLPIVHEERVAVVGAGPSGLACANEILRRGYGVTVFESSEKAGGMLRHGIPAYRLPDEVLDRELEVLRRLGVEIVTGHEVEGVTGLLRDGYSAVYVAIGAPRATPLAIEGEDLQGVRSALDFLREVNAGRTEPQSGTVLVIGGGNSAIDAARAARRLGAEVTIVYRRSREQMPAHDWEVEEAEAEGVRFEFLAGPLRLEGAEGKVARLVCQRMELGEADRTGRRRPMPVENSEFTMQADLVLPAVGQRTDLGEIGEEVTVAKRWETVEVDPLTQQTDLTGVFAGGDAATGPATVVEAFGAGKRAAESIDRFLQGIDLRENREHDLHLVTPMEPGVKQDPRVRIRALPPEQRAGNFDEVVATLSEDAAVLEAERCLGCGVFCESLVGARGSGAQRSDEHTLLVTIEVDDGLATKVAGIRIQDPSVCEPLETVVLPPENDDEIVVCRCERVTLGQIREAIRGGVRDMNQLKAMLGAGLGACGGKTCGPLIRSIFRREGVPDEEVTYFTERPLTAEVPFGLFGGVEPAKKGGAKP